MPRRPEVRKPEPPKPELQDTRLLDRISLVVIAVALVCYLYPQHSWKEYRNVNEQARLYLVKAVVEEHVLNIDNGIKVYGDLQDKASKDGHFYCDKPIGLSVFAVPVYAILHAAGSAVGFEWTIQRMRYVLCAVCVTVPSILLLLLLSRYWRRLGADSWLVGVGLIAYGLGTIAFTYSTQFVGHQLAAVIAFAHFFVSRDFDERVPWPKMLLAGALAGFGSITDYFSALMHVAIVLSYARRIRPLAAWGPFLAGGIVAFAPLPLYNLLAFGAMTKMSYGQEALPQFQTLHGTGFFGVTFPRPESISGLLISPAKGLLWLSPFLLLGVFGLASMVRERERKRDGIIMAICVAIIVWLGLSVVDWRAGWTVGPRHMVSMLPFLSTGVVELVRRKPRLFGALVAAVLVSLVLVFVPTMTLPAFDVNFVYPFTLQSMFLLRAGLVSPNVGQMLGIPGAWSLVLPALLLCGGLGYVLLQALKAKARLDVGAFALSAAALVVGSYLVSSAYPPMAEPVAMYFQARVLKQVDAPLMAGSWFEQAVSQAPEGVRRQVADRAYPEAAAVYGSLGDMGSVTRVVDNWTRLDPENPKLAEVTRALRGARPTPPPR